MSQVLDKYIAIKQKLEAEMSSSEQNKIRIQIGSATCEDAAGANEVFDEFQKHVRSSGRNDIIIKRVGCTGRCSREPIVSILAPDQMPVKYERVDRNKVHDIFVSHVQGGTPLANSLLDMPTGVVPKYQFIFCLGKYCFPNAQSDLYNSFKSKLEKEGIDAAQILSTQTKCLGVCSRNGEDHSEGLAVLVRPKNVIYRLQNEADLDEVIAKHVKQDQIVDRLLEKNQNLLHGFFNLYADVGFFNSQTRIALRNSGVIDPESLGEYLKVNGFKSLVTIIEKGDPNWVVQQITESKLRGRGGGGFPTGLKWAAAAKQQNLPKYMVCNADEGDPGAFMDRSMLEGDPFSVIEGMAIGGYAIGAEQGYVYVRAEYPLAVKRIENAIKLAKEQNLLGKNILGSGFNFDIEIRLGAGAFVCGEETALVNSIEGQRGQPRLRPPFPAEAGLWGQPTILNNVETYANIPHILQYGASWFSRIGTEKSGGTKVFALAGKVVHTGLVEVPMGTTLRHIVYDIGGGVPNNKAFKAVQTGGPAGGCITAEYLDTPVDFDTLAKVGSIMGSGGMIVMDETDCMVDIAKFFISFTQAESCGKCTPCREGNKRMLEILEKITNGKGELEDLDRLERLAVLVQKSSLCGLGKAAPNPVLSTLKYSRAEFEAHVGEHKTCPAKKCTALVHYEINDKCIGCTVCAKNCPVDCIAGERQKKHVIDQVACVKCGKCFQVCRFGAVDRI